MKHIFKNTKIIATSGPAMTKTLNCESDVSKYGDSLLQEVLGIFDSIFSKGVNCIRFNFSHSNHDERLFKLQLIDQAQELISDNSHKWLNLKRKSDLKFVRAVSNMCDTKGPEIRVYTIGNVNGVTYKAGTLINVHTLEKVVGDETKFSVLDSSGTYNMANDCVVGNKILVDDGKLSLTITQVDKLKGVVEVRVENDHLIKTNKRINLPGAEYSMPFLSKTDIEHIKFALEHKFELVALSFVNKAENIRDVKKILTDNAKPGQIIPEIYSKIETLYSLKNIDEIIAESDGIMVARGDLGLEIPYCEVPYWTKVIVKKCAIKNIPVIIATQMLDSLERSIIPTRAEVTDVYRAVELGSDATMLSGETAQGLFPIIAVETMSTIALESELHASYEKFLSYFVKNSKYSSDKEAMDFIDKLWGMLKKHGDEVLSIVAYSSDISDKLLDVYSGAKLPVPFVVFEKVKSYQDSILKPTFNKYSIKRSIYKVGVINLVDGVGIDKCFSDYYFSYNKKSTQPTDKQKVIVFDGVKLEVKSIN